MYYILSQDEYDNNVCMNSLREYAKAALEDSTSKMVYYEKQESAYVMNYYAGKVDTLRELLKFMK